MITCNNCTNKITFLNRLRSFIKLKYILHYDSCELKCDKCNTIYKMENEKYLQITRFVLSVLFLANLSLSMKFVFLKNLIILTIWFSILNPLSNLIISSSTPTSSCVIELAILLAKVIDPL